MRHWFPILLTFSLLISATASAAEQILHIDPAASTVTIDLPATGHDVHGAFKVTSGTIHFDLTSGHATGEVVVDPNTGDTGNGSRDKTMRGDVLETDKFASIVLRVTSIEGSVDDTRKGTVRLHGVLNIHGKDHPIVLPTQVTPNGDNVGLKTSFEVPFIDWGMKDPSIMFLRVGKIVTVRINAIGHVEAAGE